MEPASVFDALVTSTATPPVAATLVEKAILRSLLDRIATVPEGRGLTEVVDNLRRHGLEQQAESWIKSVPNIDVSGEELGKALEKSPLSSQWVESTAKAAGLTTPDTLDHLAHILPAVIERLSPRGELPSGPVVQASLEIMRKQLSGAR